MLHKPTLNHRSQTIWSVAIVLFVAVICCCTIKIQAAGVLRIEKVEPMKVNGGEPSFATMEVSYPGDWQKGTWQVAVNGKKAVFEVTGYGSGGGRNSESFFIYLGASGGKKIEVIFKTDSITAKAKKTTEFKSSGDLLLLDRFDGEAVLEETALHFWSYFIKDAKVKVNGVPLPLEVPSVAVAEGIVLLSCKPHLQPGANIIEYSGKQTNGKDFNHKISLFFIKDHKVKIADRFNFGYGHPGSKSGPFYKLELTGNGLAVDNNHQEMFFPTLFKEQWLIQSSIYCGAVTAKEPGVAVLRVMVKNHFLDSGYQVDREVTISVDNKPAK
jgi:hypothetical protein